MSFISRPLTIIDVCLLSLSGILYATSSALSQWCDRNFFCSIIYQRISLIVRVSVKTIPKTKLAYMKLTSIEVTAIGGLWKKCVFINEEEFCESVMCWNDSKILYSCQRLAAGYLLILSCILTVLAAIYLLLCIIKKDKKYTRYLFMVKILIGISFLIGLIGVIIGIITTYTVNTHVMASMGPAAFLALIALIINFIAVMISLFIH